MNIYSLFLLCIICNCFHYDKCLPFPISCQTISVDENDIKLYSYLHKVIIMVLGGFTMMPSLFLAHGSPMLAIQDTDCTSFLKILGETYKPKAIVIFTALLGKVKY